MQITARHVGRCLLLATAGLTLAGCVSPGYEGALGNVTPAHEMETRRTALRNVVVLENVSEGYSQLPGVSVRRCHRSFTERTPTSDAIVADLKVAAYAAGGDAISNIETNKVNGLLANCWYVLEGSAKVWKH